MVYTRAPEITRLPLTDEHRSEFTAECGSFALTHSYFVQIRKSKQSPEIIFVTPIDRITKLQLVQESRLSAILAQSLISLCCLLISLGIGYWFYTRRPLALFQSPFYVEELYQLVPLILAVSLAVTSAILLRNVLVANQHVEILIKTESHQRRASIPKSQAAEAIAFIKQLEKVHGSIRAQL